MADIIGEISKEDFVKGYALNIQKKEAAIFVGAGTSMPSGNLSWMELIKHSKLYSESIIRRDS